MMDLKAIVTVNHNNQRATLSFINEEGNSPVDDKGEELKDMIFPYSHITMYDFLFESLGDAVDGIQDYHFTAISFEK